jgi:hypothetical protein
LIEQNHRQFTTDEISLQATEVAQNFKQSGAQHLTIRNQPHSDRNEEIIFTGSYQPVNLLTKFV